MGVWIWIGALVIVSVIVAFFIKNKKERIPEIILTGLIFALLTGLIMNFVLIPKLTPSSDISFYCVTGLMSDPYWHLSLISFENKGTIGAEGFTAIIEHPLTEASAPFLLNSADNKFCNISILQKEDLIATGYENNTIFTFNASYRTIIKCEYLPPRYELMIGYANWIELFKINVWSKDSIVQIKYEKCIWTD